MHNHNDRSLYQNMPLDALPFLQSYTRILHTAVRMTGIIEASMTRRLLTSCTRSSGSMTPLLDILGQSGGASGVWEQSAATDQSRFAQKSWRVF